MIFSAILSAGASLLGASSANKASKRAAASAAADRAAQERIANQQLAFSREELASRERELDYQRSIEALNRELAGQDYEFQLEELRALQAQLLEERQYDIDRQIELDRAAAEQRAFEIEQLLNGQNISASERERALQELDEAQATARGERDEDLRRFAEEREMKAIERDFMVQQFNAARDQAFAERDLDLQFRDDLTGRIDGLSGAMTSALNEMGAMPEIPALRPEDIERELARRSGEYSEDVDRAVDRVASVNEARLIRDGLDESTPGARRRAEITDQAAQLYQDARQRAYDDSLAYITGKTSAMADNANARIGARSARLSEVGAAHGAGLDLLMQLPRAGSATDVFSLAGALPTGVHSRGIASGNDYNSPIAVNSANYDRNISNGVAPTIGINSATNPAGINLRRQLINPYGNPSYNPSAGLNAAGDIAANMGRTSAANAQTAQANRDSAFGTAGQAIADLAGEVDWGAIGRRIGIGGGNSGGSPSGGSALGSLTLNHRGG